MTSSQQICQLTGFHEFVQCWAILSFLRLVYIPVFFLPQYIVSSVIPTIISFAVNPQVIYYPPDLLFPNYSYNSSGFTHFLKNIPLLTLSLPLSSKFFSTVTSQVITPFSSHPMILNNEGQHSVQNSLQSCSIEFDWLCCENGVFS